MPKYEILEDQFLYKDGIKLYRIKLVRDIENKARGFIPMGTLGGFIEKESNLAQDDESWVLSHFNPTTKQWTWGIVYENAIVKDNAWVNPLAEIHGNAIICENSVVAGTNIIRGDVVLKGFAMISGVITLSTGIFDGQIRVYGRGEIS